MARVLGALLISAVLTVSAAAARSSSAEDFVSTTCSVALDTFSRCSASLPADQLAAICCTPHEVLTNFNCFCNPAFKEQAQDMLTADARQAVLQCPGRGHISEPIYCNAKDQQVTYWSDDKLTLVDTPRILDTTLPVQLADDAAEMLDTSLIPTQVIACGGRSQLMGEPFTSAELRRSFAQADLISNAETGANNMVVELSVEVDPTTDAAAERSFAFTRPSVAQNVADLTAEVDFEVGPDVTSTFDPTKSVSGGVAIPLFNKSDPVIDMAGGEIEQILQGVTQWVSSMVDDAADPFGDASGQQSGELSSITAHVAEVISQMASSLAGPDQDMDVEITYEFDLGAPEYGEFMSNELAADDLAALRDSMISATADVAVEESFSSHHHDHEHMHHMGHHMGHHKHRCLMQRTYRWLCHHKGFIQMALAVELVLCAVFGIVHLVWSCLAHEAGPDDSESDLKKPLIEHASDYHPEGQITISPLWAHVMDSKSATSVV